MEFFNTQELTARQVDALMALGIGAGTLYCFLGYRVLKFIIGLTGFLLAGAVAGTLAGWVSEGHALSMAIAGCLGGLCGAMALFFLYKTGIFLVGLLGAIAVAHHVLLGQTESWAPLAVLAAGVVGGLVALVIERPIMTCATAAIGAWLIMRSSYHFLAETGWLDTIYAQVEGIEPASLGMGAWALLAVFGAFTQHATRKRAKQE